MSILNGNERLSRAVGDVAEVAGYLWQRGWAERNGGNISVNITELLDEKDRTRPALAGQVALGRPVPALGGQVFLVTGTNRRMRYVSSDPMEHMAVIRVTPDGGAYEIIADRVVKPTSELASHLLMHDRLRKQGKCNTVVLHTHPTDLIAMTHNPKFLGRNVMGTLLWSMIPETRIVVPRGIGIVPYALTGTVQLADETIKLLDDYDVIMWEKHGCLAVGEDVIETFDMIDTLSKSAQIYIQAKMMGFEPSGLTDAQLEEIRVAFRLP